MLFFCKSAYRTVAILLADSAEIRKEAYQGTKEKESLQFSTNPGPVHGVRKHNLVPDQDKTEVGAISWMCCKVAETTLECASLFIFVREKNREGMKRNRKIYYK